MRPQRGSNLEHHRHPDLFICQTKKAYISIVTPEILAFARQLQPISWKAMRGAINCHGLETHIKFCRKIHTTFIRQWRIDAEIVDLLQGRVAKSVFARYYFRPDFDLEKISASVRLLHEFIN
jgi:intergrase/recombinase